jgi:phosphoglycerol transferase MdoB-like AlkP superfamily enzyme
LPKIQLPQIKGLFLRFSLLVVLYTVLRLLFYIANGALFPPVVFTTWPLIFLQGMRFDITALLYLNGLVILMQLIPLGTVRNSAYDIIQKIVFIAANLFGLILSLTDIAFYPFNLKRLDSEILGLLGSLPTLLGSFLSQFWYLFLLLAGLGYLLNVIYNRTRTSKFGQNGFWLYSVIASLLVVGLMVLGLRGGIQNRPIRPVMAANFVSLELAPLVTNSPFTFLHSVFNRRLEPKHYFTDQEAAEIYPILKKVGRDSSLLNVNKPNIVVIILESFTGSHIGHLGAEHSFTPFLDSLSQHSLYFTHAFSNGRRSSQGLVALTAGLPALMDDPYMYSPYLNNRIYGLPVLLEKMGYETSFFNGSNKEMLGWEDYVSGVGFDQYFSRETYPYTDHYDGYWGIYDHYYFDYFIERSRDFNAPFLSTLFTLSSHDPFGIPEALKEKFNSGSGKYYDALLYSDWSLSQFLGKAKQEDWFANTIFIITADHTINAADKTPNEGKAATGERFNRINLYHIPALIYAPGIIRPGKSEKVIQQTDLFNTALELAGYEGNYYSFGNSVFEAGKGCAFQYVKGVYQYIEGEYILVMKEDKLDGLYNYVTDPALENNLVDSEGALSVAMNKKLQAIIQQHNNTLIGNNMRL